MSVNFNRAKSKYIPNRREYKIKMWELDPYYDECWGVHSPSRYGFYGSKRSNKTLYFYQVRMYRTWKYNRKTQYKQK